MEKIGRFLKKYWWQSILATSVLLCAIPFLMEIIIKKGWYRPESFSDDVWFSFMGSYIGAIISVMVFFFTICLSRADSQNEIEKNRKNAEIQSEMEHAEKIYRFFMLTDYQLQDLNVELAEFRRLIADLLIIKVLIDSGNNTVKEEENGSKNRFYEMAMVEMFCLGINVGSVTATLDNKRDEYSKLIFEITQHRNTIAEEFTKRYEEYIKNLVHEIS